MLSKFKDQCKDFQCLHQVLQTKNRDYGWLQHGQEWVIHKVRTLGGVIDGPVKRLLTCMGVEGRSVVSVRTSKNHAQACYGIKLK